MMHHNELLRDKREKEKDIESILLVLQEKGAIKKEEIVAFLYGTLTDNILLKGYYKETQFGKLKQCSKDYLFSIIEDCQIAEYLSFDGFDCHITQKGKEYYETLIEKSSKDEQGNLLDLTEEEEKDTIRLCEEHQTFLKGLNPQQQKAVVLEKPAITCIAGAGSGKTTVLTKRIAYLILKKQVLPKDILAITFTRKARVHMKQKLEQEGIIGVRIHTFNSFCETLLRRYNDIAYSKPTSIMTYGQRIKAMTSAIKTLNISFEKEISTYFTSQQKKQLTATQLKQKYMNDCFSIKDYFTNNNLELKPFYKNITENIESAQTMYSIITYITSYMRKFGLRDFSDQLKDAIELMKKRPDIIPSYKHILVDEFQDINTIQETLLDTLKAPNIFCVGDPRQAIYGWRGAKVEYIQQNHATALYLTTNYRCAKNILLLANTIISPMNLPDLESEHEEEGNISFTTYATKIEEAYGVAKKIATSKTQRSDMYVIARTNKQLTDFSEVLVKCNIPHTIRNEDSIEREGSTAVILTTAHCAKGLEAEEVFVIGVTKNLFPCIKPESKVLDFVKEYYDSKSEELRLLYVALTRAKRKLHISTYGKTLSPFLKKHSTLLDKLQKNSKRIQTKEHITRETLLKTREVISKRLTIPKELILSTTDIEQILLYQPKDITELKDVIGSTKANRIGKKIL